MIDIGALGEIALYNALTKLGLAPNEAEKAVADVVNAKEVETKLDIAELKTEIGKLETLITWRLMMGLGIAVAIIKHLKTSRHRCSWLSLPVSRAN